MSGPATEKARLPNCVLLRLTAAARVVEERSWRTFESAEANTITNTTPEHYRYLSALATTKTFPSPNLVRLSPNVNFSIPSEYYQSFTLNYRTRIDSIND